MLRLFRKDSRRAVVGTLLERIAAAARRPALYDELAIPDTLEGRFESLALHVVLVLHALRGKPPPADDVAQELVDAVFRMLDASLREMGVGDVVVPKRMKRLGEAFYGRARAYEPGLEAGDDRMLAAALTRNVYSGGRPADGLARYALQARDALAALTLDALLRKGPSFPAPQHDPAAAAASIAEE